LSKLRVSFELAHVFAGPKSAKISSTKLDQVSCFGLIFKGIVHPKMNSSSRHSKLVSLSPVKLNDILKNVGNQTLMIPIDLHWTKYSMEVNGNWNGLVRNILQNVLQKQELNTGLEWHMG